MMTIRDEYHLVSCGLTSDEIASASPAIDRLCDALGVDRDLAVRDVARCIVNSPRESAGAVSDRLAALVEAAGRGRILHDRRRPHEHVVLGSGRLGHARSIGKATG